MSTKCADRDLFVAQDRGYSTNYIVVSYTINSIIGHYLSMALLPRADVCFPTINLEVIHQKSNVIVFTVIIDIRSSSICQDSFVSTSVTLIITSSLYSYSFLSLIGWLFSRL